MSHVLPMYVCRVVHGALIMLLHSESPCNSHSVLLVLHLGFLSLVWFNHVSELCHEFSSILSSNSGVWTTQFGRLLGANADPVVCKLWDLAH